MDYFKAQIETFTESLKLRNFASDTIRSYLQHIDLFLRWIIKRTIYDLREITQDHIRDYQKELTTQPITPHTIHIKLRSIKRFFEQLEKNNHLLYNPTEKILYPKLGERLPKDILSEKEMEKLLSMPDTQTTLGIRDRAILEALYSTGIRRLECSTISIHDIDYRGGYLRVTQGKGRKDRVLPVGKQACEWVSMYVKDVRPIYSNRNPGEQSLFMTVSGRKLTGKMLCVMIKKYARRAGILKVVSTHTIRHSFATHLLKNGAHPYYIQRLLGHERLDTIKKYIRVTGKEIKETHKKAHPRG